MKANKLILGIALAIGTIPFASHANVKFDAQPVISDKVTEFQYRVDRDSKIDKINDIITSAGGMKRLIQDADNGDAKSKFVLYEMYKYGIVYKADYLKAHQLLLEAVEAKFAPALIEYAYFLMGYSDVDKTTKGLADPHDSLTQVEREQLAMSMFLDGAYVGDPVAQYVVGTHYILGKGVAKDRDLGMFWLSQSQANGFEPAEAARIKVDKALNTLIDFEQISTDAKLGKVDAMVDLAKFYLSDYEVELNKEKAYRLLVTASKLGSAGAKELLETHF
ncbi:sel1 repeat family protein [Vibrio parahaemolyticus VPCR-2010]|uniref:tetratricopeptide repeat protein n=1 Tax=Vibrio parahaemolyticus TaxID=670 RepID=UPI00038E5BFA|nr:sel1 repeat family protein [Vibrio parahaemolyticus VPCR-2010]